MADGSNPNQRAWLPNVVGWFSFLGLFAAGVIGLIGAAHFHQEPNWAGFHQEPNWAGAAYLLIGGLAFGAVLHLVLRRVP